MAPITRRNFLAAASATAAVTALPRHAHALAPTVLLPDWQQQAVIDLRKSPHAKLHPVPVRAVTMHAGFWQSRMRTNVNASIPSMHTLLEQHGRMDNFRRLIGQSDALQKGPVYSDSDIYKWTEAASFAQQSSASVQTDPRIFADRIDAIIKLLQHAQLPNGYLNSYYVGDRAKLSMTVDTQTTGHELYNIGHLIQGAIAQYRATGDPRLLEICLRFIDDFLIPSFGPDSSKTPIVAGHPEIEMSLIELYRITGDKRHLSLAGYILDSDPRIKLPRNRTTYMYCGLPFTSRTHLAGHAVRAMYACSGATDYLMETGDPKYLATLTTLWQDLVHDQMYINGGVGAREQDEAFGEPFELPNANAYGESCAAIGNMMWNYRLLHATGDSRHTDIIERALYNGINSGMSLDGKLYCYRNPLAFDVADPDPIRNPWYDTTCCPPNIERTFASLPGYLYSTSPDGIYPHLYHTSTLDWHLEDGTPIRVEQQTSYPNNGSVRFTLSPAHESRFTFHLRIPAWAKNTRVTVAGQPQTQSQNNITPGAYLPITRTWRPGDIVELTLDITPQMFVADRRIAEDQGKVAVQRGPLLYCAEDLDQPTGTQVHNLRLTLTSNQNFTIKPQPNLLDGIDILEHPGLRLSTSNQVAIAPSNQRTTDTTNATRIAPDPNSPLYTELTPAPAEPTTVRLIPYYAWANRKQAGMSVWLPIDRA